MFPTHPLPPVSLQVPTIVREPLVQELSPPLNLHVGLVLSTRTARVPQSTEFPAES